MRTYETTFIINPQAEDAQIDQQVTAVIDLIKANGGEIKTENRIGTRRLAYPIDGMAQGYYTQLFYEAPQEALPVLDRHFKLEEPYIRFMTVLFEGPVPTLEDINRPIMERDSDHRRGDRDHRRPDHRDDRPDRRDNRHGRREEVPDSAKTEEKTDAKTEEKTDTKPEATPADEPDKVVATSSDETPAETAPVEATPAETAPIETTPADTAPIETTPAETPTEQTEKTESAPEVSDDDIL